MADHNIEVNYDGHTFTYLYNHPLVKMPDPLICASSQTIMWSLKPGSVGTDLKIHFEKGEVFDDGQEERCPDKPHTFSKAEGHYRTPHDYCYKVSVKLPSGERRESSDPKIQFTDGKGLVGSPTQQVEAAAIADAASKAWFAIFEKLQTNPSESAISLYPHGVTNIEVTAEFHNVKITVKVVGPNT